VFNPLQEAYDLQEMDGKPIPNSDRIECLGMILDENIKLNEWLQQKKGKIMKATFALTPISNNNFSRKLRLLLYKSLILGVCNYGLELHYNMEHS
jgi:hypothetical protein